MDWFRKKSSKNSFGNVHHPQPVAQVLPFPLPSPEKTEPFVKVNLIQSTPEQPAKSVGETADLSVDTMASFPSETGKTISTTTTSYQVVAEATESKAARLKADSLAMPPPPVPKFKDSVLRAHHGVVDKKAMTSNHPPMVIGQVVKVLEEMGIEVQRENEFRLKCVRAKRAVGGKPSVGLGIAEAGIPASPSITGSFSLSGLTKTSTVSSLFMWFFFFGGGDGH